LVLPVVVEQDVGITHLVMVELKVRVEQSAVRVALVILQVLSAKVEMEKDRAQAVEPVAADTTVVLALP
jgi:hypothetical protein